MVTVCDKEYMRRDRRQSRQFAAGAGHHQRHGAAQKRPTGTGTGAWHERQGAAQSDHWKQYGQQWEQQPHKSSWRRKNFKETDGSAPWTPAPAAAGAGGGAGGEILSVAAALAPPEELVAPAAGVMPAGTQGYIVDLLEAELQRRLSESELGDQDKVDINRAMEQLQSTVKKLGSSWCSTLFGSVANGFGVHASDLDVTCLEDGLSTSEAADEGRAAAVLGPRVHALLQEHPSFSVINKVLLAKVPILRLRFEGYLDIDLSYQNIKAVTNTRLLKAYASIDRRVRDVGIAVKLWAQASGVCGASRGHLSSYSFTLMVIYFLQVHPEVRLPNLNTVHFEADSGRNPDDLVVRARRAWHGHCSLSSVELLHRFFWFYASWFSWGEEIVCTRRGVRLFAYQDCFHQLRGRFTQRLHIEDPYELERNLHCVLGEVQEMNLQQALTEAWASMEMGGLPEGLRPPPAGALRRKKADCRQKAAEARQEAGAADAGDQKGAPAVGPDSCGSTTDQSGSELPERADQSQHSDHEDGTKPAPLPDAPGGEDEPLARRQEVSSAEHWRQREPEPEPLQESPFGDWAEEQPSPRVAEEPEPASRKAAEGLYVKRVSAASARITARVAGLCKTGQRPAPAVRSPVLCSSSSRILARVTKAFLEQGE